MTYRTTAQRIGDLEAAYDKIGGPRPTMPAYDAAIVLRKATNLIGLLRDEAGPDHVGEWLDDLTRQDLYGLVVTLGLMVPDDQTVEDLLAWAVPEAAEEVRLREVRAERDRVKAERDRVKAERAAARAVKAAERAARTPRAPRPPKRTPDEVRAADRERKKTEDAKRAAAQATARYKARKRAEAAAERQAAEKAARRAPTDEAA